MSVRLRDLKKVQDMVTFNFEYFAAVNFKWS